MREFQPGSGEEVHKWPLRGNWTALRSDRTELLLDPPTLTTTDKSAAHQEEARRPSAPGLLRVRANPMATSYPRKHRAT
jgi:hypothetical protein